MLRYISAMFLALLFVACGRERPPLNCPPPPSCECTEAQTEISGLKAKVAKLEQDLAKAATVVVEDERSCTVERAQAVDKAGLERFQSAQTEEDKKAKTAKEEIAKQEREAGQIPAPPVELGAPSKIEDDLANTLTMKASFDQVGKKCQLTWDKKAQEPVVHNDWRYSAVDALSAWHDEVKDVKSAEEGFNTNYSIAEFFVEGHVLSGDSTAERRNSADNLISVMAKSGSVVQWVTGVALRLQPEDKAFSGRQLKRLYLASKADFAKLDKEVVAAEAAVRVAHPEAKDWQIPDLLPPEYNFVLSSSLADNYYRGLVLRYWRYKEVAQKGSGKAAVAKLQGVLRGVASGMGINL